MPLSSFDREPAVSAAWAAYVSRTHTHLFERIHTLCDLFLPISGRSLQNSTR